jgi:adenosylcobinamide-GDP ribazoletransferase
VIAATPAILAGDRHMLAGALAVGTMAVASGALHLDGLADVADALLAPDEGGAERALRDPAVGAAGAVAVTVMLLIQAGSLASVTPSERLPALLVAGTTSRAVPAVVAPFAPVAAHGFGAWFAAQSGSRGAILALISCLFVASIPGQPRALASSLVGLSAGIGVLVLVAWRLGHITGDGFGAAVESSFAASLMTWAMSA